MQYNILYFFDFSFNKLNFFKKMKEKNTWDHFLKACMIFTLWSTMNEHYNYLTSLPSFDFVHICLTLLLLQWAYWLYIFLNDAKHWLVYLTTASCEIVIIRKHFTVNVKIFTKVNYYLTSILKSYVNIYYNYSLIQLYNYMNISPHTKW